MPALRGYQFTAWIIATVVVAMLYPAVVSLGGVAWNQKSIMLLVTQVVMFSMGTRMKLEDFREVLRQPHAVCIGVAGQFTIMPLLGYGLTRLCQFEPEVAAGVVLIGSCSAGLASNVMAYIAKANLALSIAMTSVTTLLAPLMTPLWMKLLAGHLVTVEFTNMMLEIVKLVILPIGAALLHDYLRQAGPRTRITVHGLAGVCALALVIWNPWGKTGGSPVSILAQNLLITVVLGMAYHHLITLWSRLEKIMPSLAMAGIVYVTCMITAGGQAKLLQIGWLLLLVAILHNVLGYVLAYGLARLCKLDTASCRTVAFEVGLQNGGMANGIAIHLGKPAMALASAIFVPWMNISGSILANYWAKRAPGPPSPRA
jgi:BASS family bile acid:Na+ symporter